MPFSVSPAVRVVEKDLSSIIPSVSSTVAAFVGRFDWGPTDTVVDISSEKELYAVFGPPSPNERGVDWFCAANFLNYGDRLKVVRVDETFVDGPISNATGATASILRKGTTGARIEANAAGQKGNALRWYSWVNGQPEPKLPSGEKVFTQAPTSTQPVYESWQGGILTTTNNGTTLDECHIALVDTLGYYGASGSVLEKFQGLSRWKGVVDSTGRSLYYKDVINDSSNYIKIESNPNRSIWHGATAGDPSWTIATTSIREHGTTGAGDIRGRYAGSEIASGGEIIGKSFGTGDDYSGHGAVPGCNDCMQYTTYFQQGVTGSIDNRLNDNGWRFVEGGGSGVTWPFEQDDPNITSTNAVSNPNVYSIINAWNKHFRDPEMVDVDLLVSGPASQRISRHLVDLAEHRKDCVAFLSPPATPAGTEGNSVVYDNSLSGYSGPSSVVTYRNETLNTSSSYAVMDSGWKYMYDYYNDQHRWVPLNPDVAGLVVRTEQTTDPWFSPAGFNRGQIQGVVKLSLNPNKAERDALYEAGINPVVSFPGEGTVLFGDKTLQRRPSALDRINVRRLMIHLEKAISTASKYNLFEFNDDFTRRAFISTVNPFLRRVQSQRGITDFRVVCDTTNNTSQVIDNNEFVADIFIKPARSINYIQLNFVVLRSNAVFEELT